MNKEPGSSVPHSSQFHRDEWDPTTLNRRKAVSPIRRAVCSRREPSKIAQDKRSAVLG